MDNLHLQQNNKFKSVYIYTFVDSDEVKSVFDNFSDTIYIMSHVRLSIENISKFRNIRTLSIPGISEQIGTYSLTNTQIETLFIGSISHHTLSIIENSDIQRLYIGKNINIKLLSGIPKLKKLIFLSFL